MNSLSLQPMLTGNNAGGFSVQSEGYIQGFALDDPAIRYSLNQGQLAATESLPMWGGVAIAESLQAGSLGNAIARATSNAGINGFAVFNNAPHWINTPQSPVPVGTSGMSVPFYRLGSGARIAVACDESLSALIGGAITQQVTWDIYAQRLKAYDAATATVSVTSITASYSATTQLWTFAVVAAAAVNVGAVGDAVTIAGVTGTGAASINQNQIITAFTNNQTFSFQIKDSDGSGADFTAGAQTGTITITEGTGALNVQLLEIHRDNSKIVVWDPINNLATWNNTGSVAIIRV